MPFASPQAFAGGRLDRLGDQRRDPELVARLAAQADAYAIVINAGQVLISPEGQLVRQPVGDAALLLGLYDGAPVFARSVDSAGFAPELGTFTDLRTAALLLEPAALSLAALTKSLTDWHARHGFCAVCGTKSDIADGGWRRHCPSCGADHFPRTDPVVIMLPVRGDRCLLGRQAAWPAGRMSALAGFLEPGESIEEACRREVFEEAGLDVIGVRYIASQPWPFPSQLMIGLIAEVGPGDARPDESELEAVAWLSRTELAEVVEGRHPAIKAPPPFAIAHALMRHFVFEG